jgi:hypothetical protein
MFQDVRPLVFVALTCIVSVLVGVGCQELMLFAGVSKSGAESVGCVVGIVCMIYTLIDW